MAKPAVVKVNQLVFYLDLYLREHKPSRGASRIERQKYAIARQSVETLKEMFMVPFPPGPGCKTPWYGRVLVGPVPFCRTPWMGIGPIEVRGLRAGKLK
jgi:hypothetical protein